MKIVQKLSFLSFSVIFLASCSTAKIVPLMPTPVIYSEFNISSIEDTPQNERWNPRRVFYATNRARNVNLQKISYTNKLSTDLSLGVALIGFGGPDVSWADLNRISKSKQRNATVDLSIAGILQSGIVEGPALRSLSFEQEQMGWFTAEINKVINNNTTSKEVLLYVHGAKVNFYNACAFTAQLDHFMGREMTSVAFAWPTRQNILSYALGYDVNRAYKTADRLSYLLEMLAVETDVRKIHIVTWSAGGRVVLSALDNLHKRMADNDLLDESKIGVVYFAAADVPGEDFLRLVPGVKKIVDRLIVTSSTQDQALQAGHLLMGGEKRIGQVRTDLDKEGLDTVLAIKNLEVINVSEGFQDRGFDLAGHQYWFNHPWASSDIILAIRYGLKAEDRGLKDSKYSILWSIPDDYPARLKGLREKFDL